MDVIELLFVEVVSIDVFYVVIVEPELITCDSLVDGRAEVETFGKPVSAFLTVGANGADYALAGELLEIAQESSDLVVVAHADNHV